jgi:poly-gamma-glutamate capsule biosynthesis protein CapA/YwtB (metallophosphatase superfamily)
MNLETALTRSIDNADIPWEKGINYHFHLDNFEGAMEGYHDVCHAFDYEVQEGKSATDNCKPSPVCLTLANNHIMDFGKQAFVDETLPFIRSYTQQHHGSTQFAGAGTNIRDASRPAHWTLSSSPSSNDNAREVEVYVIAAGSMDSGIPRQWAATTDSGGVFWLPRLASMEAVLDATNKLNVLMAANGIDPTSRLNKKSIVILSIHWGPNWAYRYEGDNQKIRREFAHKCIEQCAIDVIYGHSSHHIRGLERHNGKLIIYGAGDLINDYEGFANAGDEKYCEYGSLFLVDICTDTNELHQLTLVPTIMNRLQLKLLCPSNQTYRDMWDPRTKTSKRRSNLENASHLCNSVNNLTKLDAEAKQGLTLRVLKDPEGVESEFVLGYP